MAVKKFFKRLLGTKESMVESIQKKVEKQFPSKTETKTEVGQDFVFIPPLDDPDPPPGFPRPPPDRFPPGGGGGGISEPEPAPTPRGGFDEEIKRREEEERRREEERQRQEEERRREEERQRVEERRRTKEEREKQISSRGRDEDEGISFPLPIKEEEEEEEEKPKGLPDPLKGTQFERGFIPTIADIKSRESEALKILSGAVLTPESREEVAKAIQEGKRVEFTPKGPVIFGLPTEQDIRESSVVSAVAIPESKSEQEALRLSRIESDLLASRERGEPKLIEELTFGAERKLFQGEQFFKITLPSLALRLGLEPKETITDLGTGIAGTLKKVEKEGLPGVGEAIRTQPGVVTGAILSEVAQDILIAGVLDDVVKASSSLRTVLSPKFKKVITTTPTKTTTGQIIKDIPSGIPGRKFFDIPFAKTVSDISEPISKQLKRVGTKADLVSAQTFQDINVLLGKRLKKPLFFDPAGRLRVSRRLLEEQKLASIGDILKGDFTFRRKKKFVLVQEKGIIKNIGKFSREPETTFLPGQIPVKKKTPAVTLIGGTRAEVISIDIKKATARTRQLLSKQSKSSKEITELTKRLSKETGFKVSDISSTLKPSTPFVSPSSPVSSLVSKVSKISRGISKPSGISKAISKPSKIGKSISKISILPGRISKGVSGIGLSPKLIRKLIPPSKPPAQISTIPKVFRPGKIFEPLPSGRLKRRKKIGDEVKGFEDIVITEGFVARQLGLKPIEVKETDIRKIAEMPSLPLRIRRGVIVR